MLQVQIRLAQSGRAVKYQIPANETVRYVQEQIRHDYLIDLTDQRIISKMGIVLYSDQTFDEIQTELQRTFVAEGDVSARMQQLPCIYVFNQKAMKSPQPLKSFSEEEMLQILNQKCVSTAILKNKSQFKPLQQTKSKEQISKLQQANQNILEYTSCLLDYNEQINSMAYRFSQIKICNEDIINMCDYQTKSCNTLFKNLNYIGEQLQNKRYKIMTALESFEKKFWVNCKSIDELKFQPIPEKLQCDTKNKSVCTTVFDIFFEEQKYSDSVKRTTSSIGNLKKKLEITQTQIEGMINKGKPGKIYEDRKNFTIKFKGTSKEIIDISSKMEDLSREVEDIRQTIRDKCHTLMDAVNRYLRGPEDSQSGDFLRSINSLLVVEEEWMVKVRQSIRQKTDSLVTSHISLNRQQRLNENLLKDAYRTYYKNQGSFDGIDTDLKRCDKELSNTTKQADNYCCGKDIMDAYHYSLKQVSRRRFFFVKLEGMYVQMYQMLEEEQERRRKYKENRRKFRVAEFVSQFNTSNPQMPTVTFTAGDDLKLPKLDTNQAQEEIVQKTQRKEADYKKEIARLRERLQRYERQNETDGLSRALEQINLLTNDVVNYKKMKQNNNSLDFTRDETKISNLEGILSKTTMICHQLYSRKLKEQTRRNAEDFNEEIARLNSSINDLDTANRRLKEQIKDLKLRGQTDLRTEKDSIEVVKKRSKVETAELSRTKQEQLKGCIMEIGKWKEQALKKDDQIRDLQKNLKLASDEKQMLVNEVGMLARDMAHLQEQLGTCKARIESLETCTKTAREEYRQLEKQLHVSEQQKFRSIVDLKEHLRRLECSQQPTDNERLRQLEEQNLQVKQINEQHQIEFRCKESCLREKLQVEQEKVINLSSKIKEMYDSLESHSKMITQLKMMLGDKQIQLISKDDHIKRLQTECERLEFSIEDNRNTCKPSDSTELISLREQNDSLKAELQSAEMELRLIIMKETYEVQTQTTDLDNSSSDCLVDIGSVERGKRMFFIPYSTGVYLPLAMVESHKTQCFMSNTTVMSYRNNYFLDMGSLEGKTRDFLNECSLVIVSKVDHIRQRITSVDDNPFGLKINEPYYLIEVDKPEFIVGFEQQDVSLKNYAYI